VVRGVVRYGSSASGALEQPTWVAFRSGLEQERPQPFLRPGSRRQERLDRGIFGQRREEAQLAIGRRAQLQLR